MKGSFMAGYVKNEKGYEKVAFDAKAVKDSYPLNAPPQFFLHSPKLNTKNLHIWTVLFTEFRLVA